MFKISVLPWWFVPVCVSISILILYWLAQRPYGVFNEINMIVFNPPLEHFRERNTRDWSPYMDVLSEEEAFSGHQITNSRLAIKDFSVYLNGDKSHYTVGENIYVSIQTFDFNGNDRQFGGDHIRVRMMDVAVDASSSGYVLDHGNGSYTGVLVALWAGKPRIFVDLVYTREEITYLYELRRKLPTLRSIGACYTNKKVEEFGDCLPFIEGLDTSLGVCDVSSLNGEMPWFCQMPSTPGLTCEHFSWIKRYDYNRTYIENAVKTPFWRNITDHGKALQIFVKDKQQIFMNEFHKPSCPGYDKKKLWNQRSPIGYFHNGSWILSHCVARKRPETPECLRGKTVFLFGDSTVKQWFAELMVRFNCSNDGFHSNDREAICWNKDLRLTIYFVRHNLPGNIVDGNIGSRTLEGLVDSIEEGAKPVFLVHLFSHYTYYHHSIYRDRIKRLRSSIENILEKRPDSIILFKGPHTFSSKYLGVSEYFSYVYRLILMEELKELRDKVVYLDMKDLTIAKQVKDLHPTDPVVKLMVDQMMAYIC